MRLNGAMSVEKRHSHQTKAIFAPIEELCANNVRSILARGQNFVWRVVRAQAFPSPGQGLILGASADLLQLAGTGVLELRKSAKDGTAIPAPLLALPGFFMLVTPSTMHFADPLPLRSGVSIRAYDLRYIAPPCGPVRRTAEVRRLVGQHDRPRQTAGHRSLLRDRRQ